MNRGNILAFVGFAVLVGVIGYWLGHRGASAPEPAAIGMGERAPMTSHPAEKGKILFYRNCTFFARACRHKDVDAGSAQQLLGGLVTCLPFESEPKLEEAATSLGDTGK